MPSSKPQSPNVSLFDIFIGSGRTIRKPTGPPGLPLLQASTTSLQKTSGQKTDNKNKSNEGKKKDSGKSGDNKSGYKGDKKDESSKPNNDGGDGDTRPEMIFTKDQDATLMRMKKENPACQWNDVAAATGKPAWALKARFKELKNDGGGGDKGGEQGQGKDGDGKNKANTGKKQQGKEDGAKAEKQKDDGGKGNDQGQKGEGGKGNQQGQKGDGGKGKEGREGPGRKYSYEEWIVIAKDDRFTFTDLKKLGEVVASVKDKGQDEWLKVSSRFYDLTGRRVEAEDLKEKCARLERGK